MEQFRLSKNDADAIKALIEPSVKEVIIFESLQYIGSRKFTRDESVYHIFGAYNETYRCMQAVTYSPTSESIEFRLYPIKQKS